MPSKLNAISTGTPSLKFTAAGDGALEIQNDGNTAISISPAGIATFANPTIQMIPLFSATFSAQTVTNGVETKYANETVILDNYNGWNAANNRWITEIPGWYELGMLMVGESSSVLSLQVGTTYINGAAAVGGLGRPSNSSDTRYAAKIVHLNVSDYVEWYNALYGSGTLQMSATVSIKMLQRDPS